MNDNMLDKHDIPRYIRIYLKPYVHIIRIIYHLFRGGSCQGIW